MSEEQAVDSREDTVMTEVVTEDSGQLKDAEMAGEESESSSSSDTMESELDEDDIDLLEHTLGTRRENGGFRNLQRRAGSDDEGTGEVEDEEKGSGSSEEDVMIGMKRRVKGDGLDRLFDESEDEGKGGSGKVKELTDEDEDDLDDFIEDDFVEDDEGAVKAKKRVGVVKQNVSARFGSGLSKDILQDMLDVFGDGSEYADLVDESNLAVEMDDLAISKEKRRSKKGVETAETIVSGKDVPERYQSLEMAGLGEGELERETLWVSRRLLPFVQERLPEATVESLIPVVSACISLMRDQLLEVPFIATHRKEYFQHMLGLGDLWRILDWDVEWRALGRQREAFGKHAAQTVEGVEDDLELEIAQEYHRQVVRFGNGPRVTAGGFRDVRGQLEPFIRSFSLQPSQLLLNWATKERRHQPGEATSADPEIAAAAFITMADGLSTPTAVLRRAEALASAELAFHPDSSRMFRTALEAVACVSVEPTALGEREIGMRHELANVKWLAEKPVSSFTDDLYLRLVRGEKAGLLKVSLVFRRQAELESEWTDHYVGTGEPAWIECRRRILLAAIQEHLVPRVRRHLTALLTRRAELHIAHGCQYALQSKLMQAPHSSDRIMVVSWGEGGGPTAVTMAVCLDAAGRVVEQARFLHLDSRDSRDGGRDGRGGEEFSRLLDLIESIRPGYLVVSGQSVSTADLHARLAAALRDRKVSVVWGDDDIARIYQHSPRASQEFPEFPALLRYCVSVGRRWLCPLFELAAASVEEICRLPLHPAQSLCPPDLLAAHLQRAFVNVTNLVGLDIQALSNPWARSPLKYVAGLGPLKAAHLTAAIGRRAVEKRSDLASHLGPIVYTNAASFLRIPHHQPTVWPAEPLDGTRIHPENYPLARKIASDAMRKDANDDDEDDDDGDSGRRAIIGAMLKPERLNDLLLDEYARELEKRLHVPKHLTLLDIKAELQAPYADLRSPLPDTPLETVFEGLSGETESSLFIGQLVQVKVLRLTERAAICRLDSGLIAILPAASLPPQPDTGRPPSHPNRILRPHQSLLAAVTDINLERMEITVSATPEDLKEPRLPIRHGDFDPYYDHEAAYRSSKAAKSSKTEKPTAATTTPTAAPNPRRLISHPSYREVSRVEAERLLAPATIGEVIIRPSAAHGKDHLTLTWKVDHCDQGSLFQHVDIAELPGKRLSISLPDKTAQVFEDLDEIIARYVEQTAACIRDAKACPKFLHLDSLDKTGSRSLVESHLASERARAPGRIAYCLSLSRDKPGALLLSYQPGNRCYHEPVDVYPSGFRLRKQPFDRIDALINWFKQNFNRP